VFQRRSISTPGTIVVRARLGQLGLGKAADVLDHLPRDRAPNAPRQGVASGLHLGLRGPAVSHRLDHRRGAGWLRGL